MNKFRILMYFFVDKEDRWEYLQLPQGGPEFKAGDILKIPYSLSKIPWTSRAKVVDVWWELHPSSGWIQCIKVEPDSPVYSKQKESK
jgi:hypothetical protein